MEIILDIKEDWVPIESAPGQPYRYPEENTSYMGEKYGDKAGVYRWAAYEPGAKRPHIVYVGETDSLAERVYEHRHGPYPKEQLDTAVSDGLLVRYEELKFKPFSIPKDSDQDSSEFASAERLKDSRAMRRLLENYAILTHDTRSCRVLNR